LSSPSSDFWVWTLLIISVEGDNKDGMLTGLEIEHALTCGMGAQHHVYLYVSSQPSEKIVQPAKEMELIRWQILSSVASEKRDVLDSSTNRDKAIFDYPEGTYRFLKLVETIGSTFPPIAISCTL
jgi:hypothetical protein